MTESELFWNCWNLNSYGPGAVPIAQPHGCYHWYIVRVSTSTWFCRCPMVKSSFMILNCVVNFH